MGCGRGWLLSQALKRGWEVQGLELAGSADLHLLPELQGKVRFIGSEAEFASLEPESYDAICSYQVFEHLAQPAESIRAWTRALKPGGLLVLDTPNAGGCGARRYRENWIHHGRKDHFVLYTRQALEQLARGNGIRTLRVTYGGSPAVCTGPAQDSGPVGAIREQLHFQIRKPHLHNHNPRPRAARLLTRCILGQTSVAARGAPSPSL